MNTNSYSGLWNQDGNAVSELLWLVSAITITIPLLSILFDANQTVPNQSREGILVRKFAEFEGGILPIINICKARPHFVEPIIVKSATVSTADRQVEKIEELIVIDLDNWDGEKMEKLAECQKIDPLLITLPAARKCLLGEQRTFLESSSNRVQLVIQQGTVKEKLSASVFSDDTEKEYLSAEDFVSGIISQAFQEK